MHIVFGDEIAEDSKEWKLKRKQLIQRLHLARAWLLMEEAFGTGALALIPRGFSQK